MCKPRILTLGEQCLVVEFGRGMDPAWNDQALSLHRRLMEQPFPGYIESIPAYSSLTVCLDLERWCQSNPHRNTTAVESVMLYLERLIEGSDKDESVADEELMLVPVCYDVRVAPDLEQVAGLKGLAIEEVVRLHTSTTYRVYMNGFVPGFPYLGVLPAELEMQRKSTPALRIHAGSVAIAGRQTGIYPFETPGGWQVIGKTPWKLFDKSADPCCLLRPGMRVRFKAVGPDRLNESAP